MDKLNNKESKIAIYNNKACGPIFGDGYDLFIADHSNKEGS
jgi:hypothetical protein